MAIEITYRRTRRMSMRIVKNGDVHVSVPIGVPKREVEAFIEQHPELEYIKVSWTRELTDISPLLTLRNLDAACISHDMQKARESLGDDFPFRLDIEY